MAYQTESSETRQVSGEREDNSREGASYLTPAVDICETDRELLVLVDMPGVSSDRLEIEFKQGILSIVGRVPDSGGSGEDLVTEYQRGDFFRSFRLPESIDGEKIRACMSNGVLRLALPKKEKVAPKQITISCC